MRGIRTVTLAVSSGLKVILVEVAKKSSPATAETGSDWRVEHQTSVLRDKSDPRR